MPSNLAKRMGFARSATDQQVPTRMSVGSVEMMPVAADGGKDPSITTYEMDTSVPQVNERKLSVFREANRWDPNLSNDIMDDIDDALDGKNPAFEGQVVGELLENSPYPEVRAAVRNWDVDVPANTIRAWVIGMLLTTIGSGLNAFFSLRNPSISITSIVAQLVAYPVGKGWEYIMPKHKFKMFGGEWSLNPGPFNIKEHTLIVIMANASFGGGAGYFTDTIVAQQAFYGAKWGWGFSILVALSTQMVGFGYAGVMRRFLVEPAAMLWPSNLVNTTFMYSLHDHSKTDPATTNGWTISRYRYYYYVFIGSFVWYWFPGFIAQFLSAFAFVTWIAPNNRIVNVVFGQYTGMSLLPITFDWTQITGYVFSPLISPFHAIGNTLISLVIFYWIVAPAIHFSGALYSDYLPFSDSYKYDNTGGYYNTTRILTSELTLNATAYSEYSPLFLSTTFALAYGLSFAAIASLISHTALFHGREIWIRWKASREDLDDVHTKLMKKYKTVPFFYYMVLLVIMLGLSFATIYVYPTHLTWWALILAFAIAFVWTIPIGIIAATTNITLGLNVFTEFIIGYMLPGRPVAMMLFKTFGYITMTQALTFVQDLKLGHYLKVPPRVTFWGQGIATFWSCLVQVAVIQWGLTSIPDVCHTGNSDNKFTCPNGRVFFNASVIWGLIGPGRIFSGKGVYATLQFFWIAGFLGPFAVYFAARRWPKSPIRFINMPIIFGGTGNIPPATPLNYLSWALVGYIFNKYIKNKYRGWWMRFNYITSAGLDSGLAISTIVVTVAISFSGAVAPQWWGNVDIYNTMDALDTAIKSVPETIFGPSSW